MKAQFYRLHRRWWRIYRINGQMIAGQVERQIIGKSAIGWIDSQQGAIFGKEAWFEPHSRAEKGR